MQDIVMGQFGPIESRPTIKAVTTAYFCLLCKQVRENLLAEEDFQADSSGSSECEAPWREAHGR